MRLNWLQMLRKPLVILYLCLSVLNIWAAFSANHALNMATKPLLMVVLSLFFWKEASIQRFNTAWWVLIGLICSISGDTWLLWDDNNSFLLGLVSFLLAHTCYLIGFLRFPTIADTKGVLQKPWLAIPLLLFWIGLNYTLRNDLKELQVPVLIYSGVITGMALSAVNLRVKLGNTTNTLVLGVFLFMFSDTIIALSKFKPELGIFHPSLIIMFTYILGQWLIATGTIRFAQNAK